MSLCQTVEKSGVILRFEVFLSHQACFVAFFTAWSCVTLHFLIDAWTKMHFVMPQLLFIDLNLY